MVSIRLAQLGGQRSNASHQPSASLAFFVKRFEEVGGENIQRWRFMRSSEGTYHHGADARVIRGVVRVFGYPFDSEEAGRLALSSFGTLTGCFTHRA